MSFSVMRDVAHCVLFPLMLTVLFAAARRLLIITARPPCKEYEKDDDVENPSHGPIAFSLGLSPFILFLLLLTTHLFLSVFPIRIAALGRTVTGCQIFAPSGDGSTCVPCRTVCYDCRCRRTVSIPI